MVGIGDGDHRGGLRERKRGVGCISRLFRRAGAGGLKLDCLSYCIAWKGTGRVEIDERFSGHQSYH